MVDLDLARVFALSTLERSARTDQFLHTVTIRDMFLTCFLVSRHVYIDFKGDDHIIALLKRMCIHV